MNLTKLLKNYNEHNAGENTVQKTEDEKAKEEEKLFTNYYAEWSGKKVVDESYKAIPQFYFKLPGAEDVLLQKLREEARAVLLERKNREILCNDALKTLLDTLNAQCSPPLGGNDLMINYDDFMSVADLVEPKCKPYFTAKIFGRLLHDDSYGRISISQFHDYVTRKGWLHESRIGLSLYDTTGQGYLTEVDLDTYIQELIPSLTQLNRLEKSFHQFYVCTAVRKFLFFLDPMKTGKVKIQDMLACGFLDDLVELRDETLPKEIHDTNWFSAYSTLRVYDQYLKLDTDHNGMLSKAELSRYGTGTLTNVFIEQFFYEYFTYDGEMDFKTYLDFVLALEYRREPQSLQYLFRILDVQHKGYIDVYSLNYFFRAIQEQMKLKDQELVSFADIKNEIFDMVKPEDPLKITLQDLIRCGQGDTVVSILIDSTGFLTYENREAIVSDPSDEMEN